MRLIDNLKELKVNFKKIDNYINDKKDPEYNCALNLIKRGTCFVAVKKDNSYKFYPSRFIGYANNNMSDHINNKNKDGRETNPTISEILESNPLPNENLNNLYKKYCEELGFVANEKGSFGVERKFWYIHGEQCQSPNLLKLEQI